MNKHAIGIEHVGTLDGDFIQVEPILQTRVARLRVRKLIEQPYSRTCDSIMSPSITKTQRNTVPAGFLGRQLGVGLLVTAARAFALPMYSMSVR